MRAIGYRRVSTREQADSGAGMGAQLDTIYAAIRSRPEWLIGADYKDEGVSGGIAWQERPGLSAAIAQLERGEADILVVAKLDRLSRSMADFANLVARAKKKKWALLILDVGLDLSSPTGELMANILAAFSQFERSLISQRTKEGLARKKADGIVLGRRSRVPEGIINSIVYLRSKGRSYQSIADWLNAEGFSTAQGGTTWRASSVRAVYRAAGSVHAPGTTHPKE